MSKQNPNNVNANRADHDPEPVHASLARDAHARLLPLIALVFEHRLELFAQFGRILMPVRRSRMLYGRVEHFFFRARNF